MQHAYTESQSLNHGQFITFTKWNFLGIFVHLPSLSCLITENDVRGI